MAVTDTWVSFHYDWYSVDENIVNIVGRGSDDDKKADLLDYIDSVGCEIRKMNTGLVAHIPGTRCKFSGLLSVYGESPDREQAVGYVLSPDRLYSPVIVSCSEKEYGWIEKILKQECDEKAYLSRLPLGWLFNERSIVS